VSSWKAYQESMPSNCALTGISPYGVRHNPPTYLSGLAATCPTLDVPYGELQADLDNDTLPAFSFVTPNNINNMHDGSDPTAIQNGDAWLAAELPKILNSAAYQSGNTVVFLTFDEGEFGPGFSVGEDCAKNVTDSSCHIPMIVISPYTRPGSTSATLFNHYSLLKTTEQLLGIRQRLGKAKGTHSLRPPFRL
jgi:phosphatidylinositol-3-phosphatase